MSTDRFFFLLREPLSIDYVTKLVGRAVAHKFDPIDSSTPAFVPGTVADHDPSCDPATIIPNILPKPSSVTDVKRSVHVDGSKSLRLSLASLFDLDLSLDRDQSTKLESDELKTYVLASPTTTFDALMANEGYANAIENFVRTNGKGRAYLVTGFMTATNTLWSRTATRRHGIGGKVTVPVGAIAGAPVPLGIGDPSVGPSMKHGVDTSGSERVVAEQIFAVKYHVIKAHPRYNLQKRAIERKVKIGPPKKAKTAEIALTWDESMVASRDEIEAEELDLFLADESEAEYDSDG